MEWEEKDILAGLQCDSSNDPGKWDWMTMSGEKIPMKRSTEEAVVPH